MGVLSTLLTLPVAPLRGLLWLAEHIDEQIAAENDPVAAIRRELAAVEAAFEAGDVTEDECADRQDALLERLLELSGPAGAGAMSR